MAEKIMDFADKKKSTCPPTPDSPSEKAWKYLSHNDIVDVIQSLTSSVVNERPENLLDFLLEKLHYQTASSQSIEEKAWICRFGSDDFQLFVIQWALEVWKLLV